MRFPFPTNCFELQNFSSYRVQYLILFLRIQTTTVILKLQDIKVYVFHLLSVIRAIHVLTKLIFPNIGIIKAIMQSITFSVKFPRNFVKIGQWGKFICRSIYCKRWLSWRFKFEKQKKILQIRSIKHTRQTKFHR